MEVYEDEVRNIDKMHGRGTQGNHPIMWVVIKLQHEEG